MKKGAIHGTLKIENRYFQQPIRLYWNIENTFYCLNEEENGNKHRCKQQCATCPELYGEELKNNAPNIQSNKHG